MKLLSTIYIAVIFILPMFLVSCDDSNNSSRRDGVALTENDFAADDSITVDPEKDHFVTFLEHPDSDNMDLDTGETGTDLVYLEFSRTVMYTACWEEDNTEAEHFLELYDAEGGVLLRAEANGDCPSAVIEPGLYEVVISHDGKSNETFPIFGIPQSDEQTDDDLTLRERVNEFIAVLLSNFDMSQGSYAQTVQDNVNTLIKNQVCNNCNLRGVDLSSRNLNLTDLRGSDFSCFINETTAQDTCSELTNVQMNGVDLRCFQNSDGTENCTNFSSADLTGASLSTFTTNFAIVNAKADGANFESANLDNTNLSEASFRGSKLGIARLSNSTVTATDFSNADLTGAILTGTNLNAATIDGTVFDMALWCDGTCKCGSSSTDECVGCSNISTCSGSDGS